MPETPGPTRPDLWQRTAEEDAKWAAHWKRAKLRMIVAAFKDFKPVLPPEAPE